ncbi:alpha/beta fold hydrolase [Rhabdothermincola salaria]|uniref:alpha/beta fold hydrolase n=1 Tax=Rhabdothermincola salaria TaxID=2903142 RepID=UPI001E29B5B5|nr:alpha/beta hydrolase [Rhabdothermincola salaria]MCD9625450.1 alpha/beta hydrolase [Rhabdothermincola salaria]
MSHRTEHVPNGRLRLALHVLAEGEGLPLLVLHGLGDRTGTARPPWSAAWPGPVLGLDFTGHGASDIPTGGGYTPENLMADVDAVLAVHGPVCIVGRGLGAWVALLIAGARPHLVHGVVLADGTGLAGGGPEPPSPHVTSFPAQPSGPPDPYALLELSRDVRPPDYAMDFLRFVVEESDLEAPIVVSARIRPPWVEAVADAVGVIDLPLEEAVAHLARTAT